jgi:hypothetical protein
LLYDDEQVPYREAEKSPSKFEKGNKEHRMMKGGGTL